MKVYCDGGVSGNPGKGAIAYIVYNQDGKIVAKHSEILYGIVTNNQAEYRAVFQALSWLGSCPGKHTVYTDSELVVKQVIGKHDVRNKKLAYWCMRVQDQLHYHSLLDVYRAELKHIPREENTESDALVHALLKEYIK